MLIGYARVSTIHQNLDRQLGALRAAGCEAVLAEKVLGQGREGPAGVGEAIDKPHLDLTTKIGQGFLAFLSALAEDER
jgi:hypothetical protein